MNQHSFRIQVSAGVLFLLGCAAYSLPWIINPGAGLSFGAYDLAEWASLHPAVRESNPMLLTSLFLRLPLACLGLLLTIGIFSEKIWPRLMLLSLIAFALLPPLEFFTQYRDDPNYRQQFFLAGSTMIIGVLSIAVKRKGSVKLLVITLVMIGAISSLWGLIQGYSLMRTFDLPVQITFAGIALMIVYGLIGYSLPVIKQTR